MANGGNVGNVANGSNGGKTKVAVLGGGVGAMSAAFELTDPVSRRAL